MTQSPVPPGHLAAIVTHLELARPPGPPPAAPQGAALERMGPEPGPYLALWRAVGAPWLWASRLLMPEAELAATLADPAVHAYRATLGGAGAGILELDFREAGACEIAFLGLVPGMEGRGLGRWLMGEALARAVRPGLRVHVHTCTLDSPAALPFYLASGFKAMRRETEIFPDPRAAGLLPREAAPQVPML